MYDCPHCGKPTFVGTGTCNHCNKAFTIARLEDLYMRSDHAVGVGQRIVAIDANTALVVTLLAPGAKASPKDAPRISIIAYRRANDGWSQKSAQVYPADAATQIADAILEVAE